MGECCCATCGGFVRFQTHLRDSLKVRSDQNHATAQWFVAALKAARPCERHPETFRLALALSLELEQAAATGGSA
jgi:hypothetical protein